MKLKLPSEISRILAELFVHKRKLVLVALTGMLMASAELRYVMSLKDLVDGVQLGNQQMVISTILLILGLALIKGVSRYFHLYLMNYVGEMVAVSLRKKLQAKFMNLSASFHNNFSTGSGGLISRILNDIIIIQHGLRMFADLFREPILLVGLIVWLFVLDWQLTTAIIILLPTVLFFLRWLSKGIKRHSFSGQEDLERITSTIKESLDGVRIIQSFNLEKEMQNRFDQEANAYLGSRRRIHRLVEASGPTTEYIMTIIICVIFLYMVGQVDAKLATYGVFASYGVTLLTLSTPVKKIQEAYVRIQEVIVAAQRTFSLLDDTAEVPQSGEGRAFPSNWNKIEYRGVSLSYGDHAVLKKVNLTIRRGEIVAFVGSSGSGKSSLVNLLGRFFDPTEGQIFIDDVPLNEFDVKDLRKHISLVTQDVFLFSDTIERNIWAGDFSKTKDGVVSAAQSANAHPFIMRSPKGYQSRVGDRGSLLSGGEKQRISIARALFKDAPILILDEATSALDSVSEIEVQKGLDTLMKGRTTLVIAHRLSTISKADRIVVLKGGQIIEQGTHQTLIQSGGEYHSLYQTQLA